LLYLQSQNIKIPIPSKLLSIDHSGCSSTTAMCSNFVKQCFTSGNMSQ
jgi:hypothetical protein